MWQIIFDYIENNWMDFIRHCKEHGVPEDEVEEEIDTLKRIINRG